MGREQSYKVRIISGEPEFDAMPVAKVIDYPLEQRDYRPFAQNVICIGARDIYVRMWAFEAAPARTSELRGVFYLYKDKPLTALHIRLVIEAESSALPRCAVFREEGGAADPVTGFELRGHSGEDLQGIYWGGTVRLPFAALGGKDRLITSAGEHFPGNFYKLCQDDKMPHYGCFFPADFKADPYARESMGDFEIVAY
ncbi:MAG: hypothetical protein LBV27_09950 [Oscillospiraceae bacterium]|jgi:hypothetical protein|nr:hypothetical protein [Oscillospiraceae bacterium]